MFYLLSDCDFQFMFLAVYSEAFRARLVRLEMLIDL